MIYFLDTEFSENGVTIEPISLALVTLHGDSLYMEFEHDPSTCNEWVKANVLTKLCWPAEQRLTRNQAAANVLDFVGGDLEPEFWAHFGSYDWVMLCQLFGRMVDLPKLFPMAVMDTRQLRKSLGLSSSDERPPEPDGAHNALTDAIWTRDYYLNLKRRAAML